MLYDLLNELRVRKKLYGSSFVVSDPSSAGKRRYVFGREVTGFTRTRIRFRGGETGYEEFTVPLEDVLEIESGGKVIFRKRPRIKKVRPR